MQPHQERVVKERDELVDKTQKLGMFFNTKTFAQLDEAERNRLYRQHGLMEQYRDVLTERIEAFV